MGASFPCFSNVPNVWTVIIKCIRPLVFFRIFKVRSVSDEHINCSHVVKDLKTI